MFRLTLNICSKTFQRCQSNNIKLLQNRASIIPKRLDNYMACFKYSTIKTDDKPPENLVESVENVEHIYIGPLGKQMQALKFVSLTSSLLGIYLQPLFYEKSLEFGGTPAVIAVCGIVGFFTFVTPLLLHLITRKYVVDIHYDHHKKVYVAKTISFFVYKKKLEFTPEDIGVPDSLGMFTCCYIKGKPMFFDPRFFKDPQHYAKIMGYDKPMDFKMGDVDLPIEETKKQ